VSKLKPGDSKLTARFAHKSANGVIAGAAIGDNQIVRGDGGANGIQGSLPEVTDAGDIVPPTDGTLNVGTAAARFAAFAAQRMILSTDATAATIQQTGYPEDPTVGLVAFSRATNVNALPAYASAVARQGSTVLGRGRRINAYPGTGRADIEAGSGYGYGYAGFAFGSLLNWGLNGNARMYAQGGGNITIGSVDSYGGDATIIAQTPLAGYYAFGGNLAGGTAYSAFTGDQYPNSDAHIEANGAACFAWGFAAGGWGYGDTGITAGYSPYGMWAPAWPYGAVAMGMASGGHLQSWGWGTFALGSANGGGDYIRADGVGSFAMGNAQYGNNVIAAGYNVGQFSWGANYEDHTFAFGGDLRLNCAGAPGTPRNGDIWVANNNVYIHSNGVTRNASNIP
jgi:hypothetical protein